MSAEIEYHRSFEGRNGLIKRKPKWDGFEFLEKGKAIEVQRREAWWGDWVFGKVSQNQITRASRKLGRIKTLKPTKIRPQ